MRRFALIGAAGFVAPRHMAAMAAVGGDLVAAVDPNDFVGILDSHFPDARFFTEIERFEEHLHHLRFAGRPVDCLTVASPNYLHPAHVRMGLNAGTDVICEKPVVMAPGQMDELAAAEAASGRRINTILQLRLHPAVRELRRRLVDDPDGRTHDVDLTYITGRGHWYSQSWKSSERKSGGIVSELGIHFIDALHLLFGDLVENRVHVRSPTRAAGFMEFEHARVRWFLSVELADVPAAMRAAGKRAFRSIRVDGEELELADGMTDLHTRSYEEIAAGRGFGLESARAAIGTVAAIRAAEITEPGADCHPFLDRGGA